MIQFNGDVMAGGGQALSNVFSAPDVAPGTEQGGGQDILSPLPLTRGLHSEKEKGSPQLSPPLHWPLSS